MKPLQLNVIDLAQLAQSWALEAGVSLQMTPDEANAHLARKGDLAALAYWKCALDLMLFIGERCDGAQLKALLTVGAKQVEADRAAHTAKTSSKRRAA